MSEIFISIVGLVTVILSAITSLSLVNWRLQSLEKKVDEHNGYAQKFADNSQQLALIRQQNEYQTERINSLIKDIEALKKAIAKA